MGFGRGRRFYHKKSGPRTDPDWDRKYVPIARARVARFTRAIPQFASTVSHNSPAENIFSKSNMGESYESRKIFLPAIICLDFPNTAIA
jgi:hypothetical protein